MQEVFQRQTSLRLFDWNHVFVSSSGGFRTVCENSVRFGKSSALCPLDRVKTEIVAQLRVGARMHQYSNKICVSEDDCKDESRLTAVRTFIYVRTISQ